MFYCFIVCLGVNTWSCFV